MMLKISLILVFLNLFSTSCWAEEEEVISARLLLAKNIRNKYVIENCDIVIEYSLHNVGNGPATSVNLFDLGIDEESFKIVGGKTSAYIEYIPAQSTFTHIVVVRPRNYGKYNIYAAEVSYKPTPEAEKLRIAVSAAYGEITIASLYVFNAEFSTHAFDWFAYELMTIPALVFPFYLWHQSKTKYESLLGKK